MSKKSVILGLSLTAALTTAALAPSVFAEPPSGAAGTLTAPGGETPPEKPAGESGGAPGQAPSESSSVEHTGVMTITEDMSTDSQTYESVNNSENAILMTGGTVTLTNPTIKKTGAADGDSADFYGTNAAVFVSGGTMNITGGTVTTDGAHANGVFAYGEGIINISNTNIKTSSNSSGALMVTGGGTLTATYVTATTDGNSSAPIRSDRGGGTMNIENGTYTSNGVGSPVIYSTANVIVKDATLESTASEGVVIEGKNSVKLSNTKLTANNTALNSQSETYKTIFIYQSMSGDADEGVGSFTAENSDITTKNGDTFFITNTTADINLTNNNIVNESGDFIRIQAGGWGNSGSNGGQVTMTTTDQEIRGGIVVDNISSLSLAMYGDSFYRGIINGANTAEMLSIHLDKDAVIVLDGDSYISGLDNEDTENKNIYANGHKLYLAGEEVKINSETPPEGRKNKTAGATAETATEKEEVKEVDDYSTLGFIIAAAASFLVLVIGGLLIASCTKKCRKEPNPSGNDLDADLSGMENSGQEEGPDGQ